MREASSGRFLALIIHLDACVGCGMCEEICYGRSIDKPIRASSERAARAVPGGRTLRLKDHTPRSIQSAVLVIAAALPILSLYAHYRAARTIDDPVLMSGLKGAAMARWVHPFVSNLDDPQALLDGNKGTL